jgi:hypothetical protein
MWLVVDWLSTSLTGRWRASIVSDLAVTTIGKPRYSWGQMRHLAIPSRMTLLAVSVPVMLIAACGPVQSSPRSASVGGAGPALASLSNNPVPWADLHSQPNLPPPAQLIHPIDPMDGLTARIQAPSSARIGQILVYWVTMSNPTSNSAVLSPCPGYDQLIDSLKSSLSAYQLNCDAAQPIPPDGSESFVMQMRIYTVEPGLHSLCWMLDEGSSSGPRTCASINLNTQHRNKPGVGPNAS